MNSFKAIILGCMILFLFASCVTPEQMETRKQDMYVTNVPMATREQDTSAKKFQVLTNKTILYLIRPSQFHGRVLNFSIVVDRLVSGILKDGSYAVVEVSPGKHFISVPGNFEGDCILRINTEKGKLYFVKMSIGIGLAHGRMYIEVINEDEGKRLVNECELIEPL